MSDHSTITIVSGSVESGKTTFCKGVIERITTATQPAWRVKGILSPAIFEADTKVGIEALDLTTGERRRLAQRRIHSSSGILTKQWSLDRSTIEWCNQVLRASVPCDLLVVDELGPLEFERDEGFYEAITALDSGRFQAALVVVRIELVHIAKARWQKATVHTIRDREHAIASVAEFIKEIVY